MIQKAVKQLQVVAIYEDNYKVVFTSKVDSEVKEFAKSNRAKLKAEGAKK